MPRYFFDFSDGIRSSTDIEGTDLSNVQAARAEAYDTLAQMTGDAKDIGVEARVFAIDVRNQEGVQLFRVSFRYEFEDLEEASGA